MAFATEKKKGAPKLTSVCLISEGTLTISPTYSASGNGATSDQKTCSGVCVMRYVLVRHGPALDPVVERRAVVCYRPVAGLGVVPTVYVPAPQIFVALWGVSRVIIS